MRETVCWNAPVIFRKKDATFELLIRVLSMVLDGTLSYSESCAQFLNFRDEFLWLEEFMRQGSERKIKVVFYS